MRLTLLAVDSYPANFPLDGPNQVTHSSPALPPA